MLLCITQADRQRGRVEKVKKELATRTTSLIPICLYHHPMGPITHTQTPKSLKSNPLHRRVTMVIIYYSTSQQHNATEISCMSSWAGPINSHGGRRGSWTRCFPNDKRYINKQLRKRNPPFLPVILLCLNNTMCDWDCVCVRVKVLYTDTSQVNDLDHTGVI